MVSGTVLNSSGDPVGGVSVDRLCADLSEEVVTDGDGWRERAALRVEVVVAVADTANVFALRRARTGAEFVGELNEAVLQRSPRQ